MTDAQRRAAYTKRRGSSASLGYDADWRKLRARFIALNPTCCVPGCEREAVDVDHVVPIKVDPSRRLEWSNLRGMCRSHHASHTAKTRGWGRAR